MEASLSFSIGLIVTIAEGNLLKVISSFLGRLLRHVHPVQVNLALDRHSISLSTSERPFNPG
jgi:hypothetical protein